MAYKIFIKDAGGGCVSREAVAFRVNVRHFLTHDLQEPQQPRTYGQRGLRQGGAILYYSRHVLFLEKYTGRFVC